MIIARVLDLKIREANLLAREGIGARMFIRVRKRAANSEAKDGTVTPSGIIF